MDLIKNISKIFILIICSLCLISCTDDIPEYNGYGNDGDITGNYFSVVGYYNNGIKEYKDLGVFKLPECRSVALLEFNKINDDNKNQAFDWFCKNTHSGRIDR